MAKLSAVILAKNEEKFIGACIESVKSFADEIIVVDDFSTDKTFELCEKLGAKVIRRNLNGDWGAQRNFAIEQANCDWIFFIDADERVTPELADEIKNILREDNKNFAWRCARLSYFWGKPLKHGGWFPDYVTRLLPKIGTHAEGVVHEKICHQCAEKNFAESKYLVHYPYRDWEHYFSKFNVYTTLAAKKMFESGKSANIFDIIIHPIWASFRMYFLRGGFLDGAIGFILSGFHYFYTMAKYVKLYYYNKKNLHVTEEQDV